MMVELSSHERFMPNGAYLHLLINHVPVILAPIGALALLIAWLTQRRAVWLYGLATITLAGASAYPVMFTGHSAEHVVMHNVAGVNRSVVHEHEEAGELTMWILLAAGVVGAYAWWNLGKTAGSPNTILALWLRALVTVLALAGAGMVAYTSDLGGDIVHHEIDLPPGASTLPNAPTGQHAPTP